MFTNFFNSKRTIESHYSFGKKAIENYEEQAEAQYRAMEEELNSLPKESWKCFEFETKEQVCDWLNDEDIQARVLKRDNTIEKGGKYEIFALYDEYRLRKIALIDRMECCF